MVEVPGLKMDLSQSLPFSCRQSIKSPFCGILRVLAVRLAAGQGVSVAQQAETGPPARLTSNFSFSSRWRGSNVVGQGPSCRCRGTAPCTGPAAHSRFRPCAPFRPLPCTPHARPDRAFPVGYVLRIIYLCKRQRITLKP